MLETWERVSIGLVRRGLTGEGPDGVGYVETLLRRANVSLDVALAEPLGTRPLVDAWTGEVVSRVKRQSDARCRPRQWARRSGGSSEIAPPLRFPAPSASLRALSRLRQCASRATHIPPHDDCSHSSLARARLILVHDCV